MESKARLKHFFQSWKGFYPFSEKKRKHFCQTLLRIKKLFNRDVAKRFITLVKQDGCYPHKHMMNWTKKMKLYILKDSGKAITKKVENILRGCDFAVHWFDWADMKSLQMIGYSEGIIHFVQPVEFVTKDGKTSLIDELTEISLTDFFRGEYPDGISVNEELAQETLELIADFITNQTVSQIDGMME